MSPHCRMVARMGISPLCSSLSLFNIAQRQQSTCQPDGAHKERERPLLWWDVIPQRKLSARFYIIYFLQHPYLWNCGWNNLQRWDNCELDYTSHSHSPLQISLAEQTHKLKMLRLWRSTTSNLIHLGAFCTTFQDKGASAHQTPNILIFLFSFFSAWRYFV